MAEAQGGDEPFDAGIITRLKAMPGPFAERLHWQVRIDVHKAVRECEWGKPCMCWSTARPRQRGRTWPARRVCLTRPVILPGRLTGSVSANDDRG